MGCVNWGAARRTTPPLASSALHPQGGVPSLRGEAGPSISPNPSGPGDRGGPVRPPCPAMRRAKYTPSGEFCSPPSGWSAESSRRGGSVDEPQPVGSWRSWRAGAAAAPCDAARLCRCGRRALRCGAPSTPPLASSALHPQGGVPSLRGEAGPSMSPNPSGPGDRGGPVRPPRPAMRRASVNRSVPV